MSDEAASKKTFEAEELRARHVELMQHINLDVLLPILTRRNVLSKQDMNRIADTKHYGSIERAAFLLNIIYKQDQPVIDKFVTCLREDKKHYGHREIIDLLEKEAEEELGQNPVFEILQNSIKDISENVNFTTFLQALMEMGTIEVETFLDLVNHDRTAMENVDKLLIGLEAKGTQGFVDFLSALRTDSNAAHDKLFKKLFSKVQKFFKEDERAKEVSYSDRIAILQLETREKVLEMEVTQRLKINTSKLIAKMDLISLIPYLRKSLVLTEDELNDLTPGTAGNEALLNLMSSKTPFWTVKFAECLREDPKNQELAQLLFPPPPAPMKQTVAGASDGEHRHDRVAVFMSMHKYVKVEEDYTMKRMEDPKKVTAERKKLLEKFEYLNFKIVNFELKGVNPRDEPPGKAKPGQEKKEDSKEGTRSSNEKELENAFKEKVASLCAEEAVVFIYMSGIQIPHEEDGIRMGAILLSEVSTISRKESTDCVKARDLKRWMSLIPTCHVTFLVDCEHSFIAKYGKKRTPDSVDMVEDPWSMLVSLDTTTVVFYLQPDMSALPQLADDDVKEAAGSITKTFLFALSHCYLKKEKVVSYLSHRRFYEAMSFYWHRRGRLHKPFIPAIVGDKDREFLGRKGIPYQHGFMVNLTSSHGNQEFDLDKLHIQVGSFVKLNEGDSMEMFHVLRPGIRVRGVVGESHPISCSVIVPLAEERKKLKDLLAEVYKDKELRSKDHSTEFLWALKVFPVSERYVVTTDGLSEGDTITIKTYLETMSSHLRYASRGDKAHLTVCKSEGKYFVRDEAKAFKDEVRVLRLELILTFLEAIAWYKHAILISDEKPDPPSSNSFHCFMTSERPLLQVAVPLCEEFSIKFSSHEGASRTGHEGIIQSNDSQMFWNPAPPSKDSNPCMEVAFKENHIVTSIELKGDYRGGGDKSAYVRNADVFYQSLVMEPKIDVPGRQSPLEVPVVPLNVQFISITPMEKKDFSLSYRPILKSSASNQTLSFITVTNWAYHQQRKTPWKFNPPPNAAGRIDLTGGQQFITWSGKASSQEPVVFDLGKPGIQIEKLLITNPNTDSSKFHLHLKSTWKREKLPEFPSAWPCKYEFPKPIVLSNLQLTPTNYTPKETVRAQMQLYGNKEGGAVEVEQGELLSFHLNNYQLQAHFVYIICLEETGAIKYVMKDVANPVVMREGKEPNYPVMKKLIQSTIPDSYSPDSGTIKDTYLVLVCQRQLYLEPLFQNGPSSYHHCLSYRATSSLGHKAMRRDVCHRFHFKVNVKQRSK